MLLSINFFKLSLIKILNALIFLLLYLLLYKLKLFSINILKTRLTKDIQCLNYGLSKIIKKELNNNYAI